MTQLLATSQEANFYERIKVLEGELQEFSTTKIKVERQRDSLRLEFEQEMKTMEDQMEILRKEAKAYFLFRNSI